MTPTNSNTQTSKPDTTPSSLVAAKEVKDFQITAPMVDVRGWTVLGPDGVTLGSVDRLMLDVEQKKPRYLSVEPADNKGHYLFPLGVNRLDPAHKRVRVDGVKPDAFKHFPRLSSNKVSRDFERQIVSTLTGKSAAELTNADWYGFQIFDPSAMMSTDSKRPSA